MLNLEGSNKTIDLIESLQKKNKELDPNYKPCAFHKPNKSLLRRWFDFLNPFYHPAELKPTAGLNQGDLGQSAVVSKTSPKHRQTSDIPLGQHH